MIHDRKDIIAAARGWLGTPYRHQASTRGAGCDCLGLLRGVWRELNGPEPVTLPPYRADMRDRMNAGALKGAADAWLLPGGDVPEAGDVILFRLYANLPPKHCGIMTGRETFIHAQEQIGTVEANLTGAWARRIAGLYLFPKRT